jgi:hypothetical protein
MGLVYAIANGWLQRLGLDAERRAPRPDGRHRFGSWRVESRLSDPIIPLRIFRVKLHFLQPRALVRHHLDVVDVLGLYRARPPLRQAEHGPRTPADLGRGGDLLLRADGASRLGAKQVPIPGLTMMLLGLLILSRQGVHSPSLLRGSWPSRGWASAAAPRSRRS